MAETSGGRPALPLLQCPLLQKCLVPSAGALLHAGHLRLAPGFPAQQL